MKMPRVVCPARWQETERERERKKIWVHLWGGKIMCMSTGRAENADAQSCVPSQMTSKREKDSVASVLLKSWNVVRPSERKTTAH